MLNVIMLNVVMLSVVMVSVVSPSQSRDKLEHLPHPFISNQV